jgi:hypothetical protein
MNLRLFPKAECDKSRCVFGTASYRRRLLFVDSVHHPSSQCVCFAFRQSNIAHLHCPTGLIT